MSKRLGNAVDPFETLSKYGPDATRWYMITNAQPWDNLKFDESGIWSTDISTLRARGKSLNDNEQSLFDSVDEISQKLLGNLDYEKGSFRISFEVVGSAMPYDSSRNTSVNVHFILENNLKH